MNKKNKIEEITPTKFICVGLGCSSVFKDEEGNLFIIGEVVSEDKADKSVAEKVGNGEGIIKVPKGLIADLKL